MNRHLDFLLSVVYDGFLASEHLADLRKSGLTDETIATQRIRTVPPHMIDALAGFPAPKVKSAYLLPFPDPPGGIMNHIRLRVCPAYEDAKGRTVKYLGPKGAGPRVFFPLMAMSALPGTAPLYIVEGAKKALAAAQLGLVAVGFEGIHGWHERGERELLPDFDLINLRGRVVEIVPDGDVRTNDAVAAGTHGFAEALERRGARVRVVMPPLGAAA